MLSARPFRRSRPLACSLARIRSMANRPPQGASRLRCRRPLERDSRPPLSPRRIKALGDRPRSLTRSRCGRRPTDRRTRNTVPKSEANPDSMTGPDAVTSSSPSASSHSSTCRADTPGTHRRTRSKQSVVNRAAVVACVYVLALWAVADVLTPPTADAVPMWHFPLGVSQ